MKHQFKFHVDPGHGWLEVPAALVGELGLVISEYSYISLDSKTMFLEEDCDAQAFVSALGDRKIDFSITEVECRDFTKKRGIRSLSKPQLGLIK